MGLRLAAVAEVIDGIVSSLKKNEAFCSKSFVMSCMSFKNYFSFPTFLSERSSCELETDQLKFCLVPQDFRGSLVTDFVITIKLVQMFQDSLS